MPNTAAPFSIGREEDGTYYVVEPGQSPQKLGKDWLDVQAIIEQRFGINVAAERDQRRDEQVRQMTPQTKVHRDIPDDHDTTPKAKGK